MRTTAHSHAAPAAWAALIGAVTAYELWCLHQRRPDDLMTRGLARARLRSPRTARALDITICTTAAHLMGVLPAPVDPFAALLAAGRIVIDLAT